MNDIESICARVLATEGVSPGLLRGKSILLSGACGFLGKWWLHTVAHFNRAYFAADPIRLVGFDSGIASEPYTEDDPHITINPVGPLDYVKFDYIIHGAAIASPPRYLSNPLETIDAAIKLGRELLEMARESDARLLYFSSSEIYGDPDDAHVPTPEDYRGNVSCVGPRSCYDESKRMGETLCDVYYRHFGVDVVSVRPFNVYGPGMAEDDRRAIPNLMRAAARGETFRVYGNGSQTRTFCFVQDAMVGFWLALLKGHSGRAYNIGSEFPEVGIKDLAVMFQERIPPLKVEYVDSPEFDQGSPTRRCPELSRARQELGYEPRVGLIEGLQSTFAAAKELVRA